MRDTYSLYEAKARLSAIIRQVREGRSVLVTLRGQPVAEIRPVSAEAGTLTERLDALTERGILLRAEPHTFVYRPVKRKAGALRRFLDERGE